MMISSTRLRCHNPRNEHCQPAEGSFPWCCRRRIRPHRRGTPTYGIAPWSMASSAAVHVPAQFLFNIARAISTQLRGHFLACRTTSVLARLNSSLLAPACFRVATGPSVGYRTALLPRQGVALLGCFGRSEPRFARRKRVCVVPIASGPPRRFRRWRWWRW